MCPLRRLRSGPLRPLAAAVGPMKLNAPKLVDTSVWIRFLAGKAPYADRLDELLADSDVLGHELVYGELLIGDRGGRPKLVAAYVLLQQTPLVPHSEVGDQAVERGHARVARAIRAWRRLLS